jgi:hypothetical protein
MPLTWQLAGGGTAIRREFAEFIRVTEKYVVSDTIAREDPAPWQDTTRIIRGAEIAALCPRHPRRGRGEETEVGRDAGVDRRPPAVFRDLYFRPLAVAEYARAGSPRRSTRRGRTYVSRRPSAGRSRSGPGSPSSRPTQAPCPDAAGRHGRPMTVLRPLCTSARRRPQTAATASARYRPRPPGEPPRARLILVRWTWPISPRLITPTPPGEGPR